MDSKRSSFARDSEGPPPAEQIGDAHLLAALKEGGIAPGTFDHRQHLRAAWIAAKIPELAQSLATFCKALKAFAFAAGKPEIYHETVTVGLLVLIRERVARQGGEVPFEEFLAANPDLLEWRALLRRHWPDDVLDSDHARSHFVLPVTVPDEGLRS